MKAVDLIPSTVSCLPDASVHNTPTVGSRKPDINVYFSTLAVKHLSYCLFLGVEASLCNNGQI
jgi:hypothetical protein